uniref:Coadhesin n=1 Tax=Ciona intestinalis TaxID=7719 RepID=A0A1W3JQT9_CIOIN|nr:coadhesin [Ciona intestinalis]|eukprot:XP_002127606.1 coadhesin [Ciona intestinalis]
MKGKGFLILFVLLFLVIQGEAWRRRRRRRRACTAVNCAWRLGTCSTTCGPGTKTYVKTRVNSCGGSCVQPAAVACNLRACPINCVTSAWSSWGTCSKTCGAGGVEIRTRTVTTAAQHGGTACPSLTESKACNQVCMNNGTFTGGRCVCVGSYTGTCCQTPPPVHCAMSAWSTWGTCSKTCGAGGVAVRTRSVVTHSQHGGRNCTGALRETKSCNEICLNSGNFTSNVVNNVTHSSCKCHAGYAGACCQRKVPVHCVTSAWSAWSNCSKTCGGGESFRTRSIVTPHKHNGTVCPALRETKACNMICYNGGNYSTNGCVCVGGHNGSCCEIKPSPVHCVLSTWSSWSNCSKTCGAGGVKTRTKSVVTEALYGGRNCSGNRSESKPCNHICYNGGNYSLIQTPYKIGHACICHGGYTGSCCQVPPGINIDLTINIYETIYVIWEPYNPTHHRSHSCGGMGAGGEGEEGEGEGGGMRWDEDKEETELESLI